MKLKYKPELFGGITLRPSNTFTDVISVLQITPIFLDIGTRLELFNILDIPIGRCLVLGSYGENKTVKSFFATSYYMARLSFSGVKKFLIIPTTLNNMYYTTCIGK